MHIHTHTHTHTCAHTHTHTHVCTHTRTLQTAERCVLDITGKVLFKQVSFEICFEQGQRQGVADNYCFINCGLYHVPLMSPFFTQPVFFFFYLYEIWHPQILHSFFLGSKHCLKSPCDWSKTQISEQRKWVADTVCTQSPVSFFHFILLFTVICFLFSFFFIINSNNRKSLQQLS